MVTMQKLRAALAKIDRRRTRAAHGRPMSGLSIPAEYYFGATKARKSVTRQDKKLVHAATAK